MELKTKNVRRSWSQSSGDYAFTIFTTRVEILTIRQSRCGVRRREKRGFAGAQYVKLRQRERQLQ